MNPSHPQSSSRFQRPITRLREALAIVSFLAALFLALSLLSYHPDDPCWSVTGTSPIQNWLGAWGAHVGDLSLKFFGLHAYLLVLVLCWLGAGMLLKAKFRLSVLALVGYSLFALLTAGLGHLWLGTMEGGHSSGGLWGMWLGEALSNQTGVLGASLLLLFGLLLAIVWTTHFSISGWLMKLWMRFEPRFRTQTMIAYERWLDWRDGWARWRWERQQRRMAKQEPQLAVADGYPSELPALELESSWLQRSHWDESMRDQRKQRSKGLQLPELTPPEMEAIRGDGSLHSDEDLEGLHDLGHVDDSSEESSFWSAEQVEEEAQPADATKDIRSHLNPRPSMPPLESAVLPKAVYIPPTLDVGQEVTVTNTPEQNMAVEVTPLAESPTPQVNPAPQQGDTTDHATLSQWEQPLALYDWSSGHTVPEAQPFVAPEVTRDVAPAAPASSAPVVETAYPMVESELHADTHWEEATSEEHAESVTREEVPESSIHTVATHPLLVEEQAPVTAVKAVVPAEPTPVVEVQTVEEVHPDYVEPVAVATVPAAQPPTPTIPVAQPPAPTIPVAQPVQPVAQPVQEVVPEPVNEVEVLPTPAQGDDFVLVDSPLPDFDGSMEESSSFERVSDSMMEESWFVESQEYSADSSAQHAAAIVVPSPSSSEPLEEAELHLISEEPVVAQELPVQQTASHVSSQSQPVMAQPEPVAKAQPKKAEKKEPVQRKVEAAPVVEASPVKPSKTSVEPEVSVDEEPSLAQESKAVSQPATPSSKVESGKGIAPQTTDSFDAFEPTEPSTQDLASRPSRSLTSLPAHSSAGVASVREESVESRERVSAPHQRSHHSVEESVAPVSEPSVVQSRSSRSKAASQSSKPVQTQSREPVSDSYSRFDEDGPLPAMDGLPSAPGVEVVESYVAIAAVPDSQPPVEEQASEPSHSSPVARELLKRAMEDKRAQLAAKELDEQDSYEESYISKVVDEETEEPVSVETEESMILEADSFEGSSSVDTGHPEQDEVDSFVSEDSFVEDEYDEDEVLQAAIDAMEDFEDTGSAEGPVVHRRVRAKDPAELDKKKEIPAWRENGYEPPSLELLDYKPPEAVDEMPEHLVENARVLERTLENFGVRGQVKEIVPGPVITIYEYLPEPGIKVSKIANLADDLAMALHAIRVRVIAPIPGKGVVGIEIPNKHREFVYLKEILADDRFALTEAKLPMAIGKSTTGSPYVANLAKMPHLLIAGTTGSGKSVGVNGMICSLLYHCSPEDVRFLMVDPKMLELSIYDGIPHLLLPVVTEPKKASIALNWAVSEMERRYSLMAGAGVRNIANYNKLIQKRVEVRDKMEAHNNNWYEIQKAREAELENPEDFDWEEESEEFDLDSLLPDEPSKDFYESLPYIVVVIDELADLMMVAAKEVEFAIARLAQMARAAGIHLLLATQRPSVDVLTGVIKANFPSRMAFQVKSKIDSRTILDQPGAERLLGSGDLLLMPPTSSIPIRLHGAYISEEEIHRVVKHLKKQGSPEYNQAILASQEEEDVDEDMPVDTMYDKAVDIVLRTRNASISYLQRKLRIGYNRSARIVEMMEREGLVGEQIGNKPREVLVPPPQD